MQLWTARHKPAMCKEYMRSSTEVLEDVQKVSELLCLRLSLACLNTQVLASNFGLLEHTGACICLWPA